MGEWLQAILVVIAILGVVAVILNFENIEIWWGNIYGKIKNRR
jgi:hypothetical protein